MTVVWRYYWEDDNLRRDDGRGLDQHILYADGVRTPELKQFIEDALNDASLSQAEAIRAERETKIVTVDMGEIERRLAALLVAQCLQA